MPTSAVGNKAPLNTHTREFHSSQVHACAQHRAKTALTAEDPKEHRDGGISGPRNWRVVMQLAASMLQAQEFERHALKISDMLSQCGHIGHTLNERGAPSQKQQLDRNHGARLLCGRVGGGSGASRNDWG